MKKILAMMMAGIMIFAFAACGQEEEEAVLYNETQEDPSTIRMGGYNAPDTPDVPEELKTAVAEATADMNGDVTYEPVAFLESQVVAGMNYRVLCREIRAMAADEKYAILTIYEDLDGSHAVTEMLECTDENLLISDLTGGWAAAGPAVTDEAKAALNKALENLDGADYEPMALVATQVVAGTNYCILCRITPVVPNPQPGYALVHVYEALDGSAEITDTVDFTGIAQ